MDANKKKGINVDIGQILLAILVGFCILATVGLVAGFTRRSCPNKVVQPTVPSTPSPSTTSQQPTTASVSTTSTTRKCSLSSSFLSF